LGDLMGDSTGLWFATALVKSFHLNMRG